MTIDEIEIGYDLPEVKPDVTLDQVRRLAQVTGMTWGRFTDHEFARKEGLPGAIVPAPCSWSERVLSPSAS